MRKVLIYGSYNHANLGDDYMMYLINNFLETHGINAYYFSSNSQSNCFDFKYNYVDNPFFLKLKNVSKFKNYWQMIMWKEIKLFDSIIFMGGGYTYQKFGIKNLLKIYLLCCKAKKNNIPIFFTGQTIGPANSFVCNFLLKRIYLSARFVGVREIFSEKFILSNSINGKLIGDDIFLSYNPRCNKDKKFVMFNYKEFGSNSNFREVYYSFLLKLAKRLDVDIKIVSFRIDESSREYLQNMKLYHYLKDNGICVEFLYLDSIDKIVYSFKNCIGVVGGAYHFVALALLYGKNAFSFYSDEYYHNKMIGLFNFYDLDNTNCILLDSLKENELYYLDLICKKLFDVGDEVMKVSNDISKNVFDFWNKIVDDVKNGGD